MTSFTSLGARCLISRLIIIDKKEEKEDVNIDRRITENLFTVENPVFRKDRFSSKMGTLLNLIKKILQKKKNKLVIVSQLIVLLDIIISVFDKRCYIY